MCKTILFFLLTLSLTACKTSMTPPADTDPAAVKLAEAADSISHSLTHLAEIQQAQLPTKSMDKLPNPSKLNMRESVSVDWSGPVEPFLKKIAQANGYSLRVMGVKPMIPVIVTIAAHDTPLANVLRDTAFQCMGKADVIVDPCAKVIELHYSKL